MGPISERASPDFTVELDQIFVSFISERASPNFTVELDQIFYLFFICFIGFLFLLFPTMQYMLNVYFLLIPHEVFCTDIYVR